MVNPKGQKGAGDKDNVREVGVEQKKLNIPADAKLKAEAAVVLL